MLDAILLFLVPISLILFGAFLLVYRSEVLARHRSLAIGEISLGTGESKKSYDDLFRSRWDFYFTRSPPGSQRGFCEFPKPDMGKLLESPSAQEALPIDLKVQGVDIGALMKTIYELTNIPGWKLEGEFDQQADFTTLKLKLSHGTTIAKTWCFEHAIGNDTKSKTAAIQDLTDRALFQLIFDIQNATKNDDYHSLKPLFAEQSLPKFRNVTAVEAYFKGKRHFDRYQIARNPEDLNVAYDSFRKLCNQSPDDVDGLLMLGMASAEIRKEMEAIDAYKRVLYLLDPDNEFEAALTKAVDQKALFDDFSFDNKHRIFVVKLLEANAWMRLYDWRSAHQAYAKLVALRKMLIRQRRIEKNVQESRDAGLRDLTEYYSYSELLAHDHALLARLHGLYLAYLRHTDVKTMFQNIDTECIELRQLSKEQEEKLTVPDEKVAELKDEVNKLLANIPDLPEDTRPAINAQLERLKKPNPEIAACSRLHRLLPVPEAEKIMVPIGNFLKHLQKKREPMVREQVKKLWKEHQKWLKQARTLQKELKSKHWTKEQHKNKRNALEFQILLADGFGRLRLASWLPEVGVRLDDTSVGEGQGDDDPTNHESDEELQRRREQTEQKFGSKDLFEDQCKEADKLLSRAHSLDANYLVAQYLGIINGDRRFDPSGKRLGLAVQYCKRSTELKSTDYYGHEELARMLRRKVHLHQAVSDVKGTIEEGIKEADAAIELRAGSGPALLYGVEFRVMRERYESADQTERELINKKMRQARASRRSDILQDDLELQWVTILKDLLELEELAEQALNQDAAAAGTQEAEDNGEAEPTTVVEQANPTEITPPGNPQGNPVDPAAAANANSAVNAAEDQHQDNSDKRQEPHQQFADKRRQTLRSMEMLYADTEIFKLVWVNREYVYRIEQLSKRVQKSKEALGKATTPEEWRKLHEYATPW